MSLLEPGEKDQPSPQEEPLRRILVPFQVFLRAEATGGMVLFACTVIALIWANSPWAESYVHLWETTVTIGIGGFVLAESLHFWINDALMAAFFFVVGLEIKREILIGELASPRQAALPIAAALGGMVVPAALYVALAGGVESRGWGVPMATDIAFALGVLTLLGKRVPLSAKIFLTALAIVDDIGAALVIAIFYTDSISWMSLALGGGFFIAMIGANRLGVRHHIPFALLGLGLWLAFLKSGVHPTLAGVLGAMAIPARTRINAAKFLASGRALLDEFARAGATETNVLTNKQQRGVFHALEAACEDIQTPLQILEHRMHPWVSFLIMPVFALANAGVSLGAGLGSALAHPVALGVLAGLVVGKQVGITLFSALAVLAGARMPSGLTWRHIYGIAWLGGIGFTMSLFIANLAFGHSRLLDVAKVGVLAASLLAGTGGWLILRKASKTDSP